MTGQALITRAFRLANILKAGETLGADDAADALSSLNAMIDRWATQRLTMYALLRTVKALTASTASYTIGTGGDINIVRPTKIEYATYIVNNTASPTQELPLTVFADQEWAGISIKSLTAAVLNGIYYDYTWSAGLGRITPWPVPTVNTLSIVLYTPQALTALALATDYTFAPGYEDALVYNLAKRCAPEWLGTAVRADIDDQARLAIRDIKRLNARTVKTVFDPALIGPGYFDIDTGSVY